MGVHDPFDDPVMGHVIFDTKENEWQFRIPISGNAVRATIVPEDHDLPLAEQGLDESREFVTWIRDNEPSIRQHITDQMFDGWMNGWYDEEFDTVSTPDGFKDAISLSGFSVEDRIAILCYKDGELFGGHSIVLSVGAKGEYGYPPSIWG